MSHTFESISTRVVHAGEPEPRMGGAVVMPIFQSANYLHEGTTDYHATTYVRLSNSPNHVALNAKLAEIESAEAAMVTASGMAAISTALLTALRTGDHLLVINAPYGGTRTFITDEFPRLGIAYTFIDGLDPASWDAARRAETRAIYVESITNPMMQVPDLAAVVAFAKKHDLVSLIDNTFATPVNFRPATLGFDLSLHSGTKYLNGHSDIAAGAAIGRADLIHDFSRRLAHLGGSLDPHACFLLNRGIKTLALRVRQQNESAMRIAGALATHPMVETVNYPGLASTPGHEHARALFDGYGGMLSVEITGGVEVTERFVERLRIPIHAASLGGVESLVIRPAVTAYADVAPEQRQALGVSDSLLRISVGIEDTDELLADILGALDHATAAVA